MKPWCNTQTLILASLRLLYVMYSCSWLHSNCILNHPHIGSSKFCYEEEIIKLKYSTKIWCRCWITSRNLKRWKAVCSEANIMMTCSYAWPALSCISVAPQICLKCSTMVDIVQVVAIDISQTLLPNMEKMVASRGLMIPTIRAWSWLVRLLGVQAGEKRHLLNRMLKVVETTFTSQDSQVQIASLVCITS